MTERENLPRSDDPKADDGPDGNNDAVRDAMAVSSVDDQTRTHSDDPDETESVVQGDGELRHLDESGRGYDESSPDAP